MRVSKSFLVFAAIANWGIVAQAVGHQWPNEWITRGSDGYGQVCDATPPLGQGYVSAAAKVLPANCLNPFETVTQELATVTTRTYLITSKQSMIEALGFSSALEAKYSSIKGALTADWVNNFRKDEKSLTFLFRANVLARAKYIKTFGQGELSGLSPSKRFDNYSWEQFLHVCGDSLVSRVELGGHYYAKIQLSFSQAQAKRDFLSKMGISASVPYLESINLSNSLKKLSESEKSEISLSVATDQEGLAYENLRGQEVILVSPAEIQKRLTQCSLGGREAITCEKGLESIYEYAEKFSRGLQRKNSEPVPQSVTVSSYDYAHTQFSPAKERTSERKQVLSVIKKRFGEYTNLLEAVESAELQLKVKESLRGELRLAQNQIRNYLDHLFEVFNQCVTESQNCPSAKDIEPGFSIAPDLLKKHMLIEAINAVGFTQGRYLVEHPRTSVCSETLNGLSVDIRTYYQSGSVLAKLRYICESPGFEDNNLSFGGYSRITAYYWGERVRTDIEASCDPLSEKLVGLEASKSSNYKTESSLNYLALICENKSDPQQSRTVELFKHNTGFFEARRTLCPAGLSMVGMKTWLTAKSYRSRNHGDWDDIAGLKALCR